MAEPLAPQRVVGLIEAHLLLLTHMSAIGKYIELHDAFTAALDAYRRLTNSPKIICLCGSTRFHAAFREANLQETLAGNIVLSIGCDMHADAELFRHLPEDELHRIKLGLDELHMRKIDLADEVLILNVGGYIGSSTRAELDYARASGKVIRFLEEVPLDD